MGTLIEAWASQKSFQPKDGGTDGDGSNFRGQQRKNDTHVSKTDADARLYRKSNGAESRLAYLGHLLIENRHGLIVDAMASVADGYAEREAATLMMLTQWEQAPSRRRTPGVGEIREAERRLALGGDRHALPGAAAARRGRPRSADGRAAGRTERR